VVIELKRGETPREVLAQALEYAAWLDSLTLDQLDALAREYAAGRGNKSTGIADCYRRTFEPEAADEPSPDSGSVADRITFNNRQRLVIVAERFSAELEQTLRYLRTRLGVDVSGIAFTVHREGNETVLVTETVVGRERPASAAEHTSGDRTARLPESPEETAARVETEFLKNAITEIPAWIDALGNPDLQLQHLRRSERVIKLRGKRQLNYSFTRRWLYCHLFAVTPTEMAQLRSRLGSADTISQSPDGSVRFHVETDADLAVVKEIIAARVAADSR
jgi:hypothetical protein